LGLAKLIPGACPIETWRAGDFAFLQQILATSYLRSPMCMHEVYDLIDLPGTKAFVVEIDEKHTPAGLALELHIVVWCGQTVAFWLFEDGGLLTYTPIGAA